jgi:aspartyl/asparaginyl beta-hydroxylase (cupin superfamily)
MVASDAKSLATAGFDALTRNDAEGAHRLFEQAISLGMASAETWYGLSCAFRLEGAVDQEGAALDRALGIDGRDLKALIAKGDWCTRGKNAGKATVWYSAAVDVARTAAPLPPFWRAEVERVQRVLKRSAEQYQEYLLDALKSQGYGGPGTERFSQAFDIMFGKRRLYLQQPTNFYFPGLPQIQFYERESFAWAEELESRTDAVRAELHDVLAGKTGIVPYVSPKSSRDRTADNVGDQRWSVFHLILDGKVNRENTLRCPRTMAALQDVPLCRIDECSPSVMFSLLQPGARIVPHHGLTNVRLICHLPLMVPPNCGALRVGNETRPWREGRLAIFDDSIEHDAWNSSSALRAVLLFDVWRPELSEQERALVSTMLTAVSRFGDTGLPPS